jgi:aminobenzoyl-glutamate transport protein
LVSTLVPISFAPQAIQDAYRIDDSVTNIISPMMSYFGLILAIDVQYKKDLGLGKLIPTMLPYSLMFMVGWIVLFYLWVFVFNMPVSPRGNTYYG